MGQDGQEKRGSGGIKTPSSEFENLCLLFWDHLNLPFREVTNPYAVLFLKHLNVVISMAFANDSKRNVKAKRLLQPATFPL